MELRVNTIYRPLFQTKTRYILLYGGRAGGRSYGVSQKILLDIQANQYSRVAVMRYVLGDVRSSVWQEIKDRIEEQGLPAVVSDQAMHYELGNNTIDGKGFKKSSSQNSAKLKSLAGYSTVWIEEAEEIDEQDFINLDSTIRTQKAPNTIILSFNMPPKDHWIIQRWFNLVESGVKGYYKALPKEMADTTYIFATYKDNQRHLPDSLITTFESYKELNPEYYYTMVLGYVSEGLKGRIFTTWQPMTNREYDELPYEKHYGLDFGFTNDPAALVEIKVHNKNIYLKEMFYETGLTNQDIVERIKDLGITGNIIADSAEPKSIEEIRREGIMISASVKGSDSVRSGINKLKNYNVFYTESSQNIAKETQTYIYKLDVNKNPTNEPVDKNNHAMDAIRYGTEDVLSGNKYDLTWI